MDYFSLVKKFKYNYYLNLLNESKKYNIDSNLILLVDKFT